MVSENENLFIFIYLFFYLSLFTVDGKDLDNMYKKIHKIATVANHRQLSYILEKSDTEVKKGKSMIA